MRRSLTLALILLALAAAPAAAWTKAHALSAPATNLAADAPATAIAVAARPGDCDHVELWNWQTNRSVRLGRARPCGPATSTGSGLAAVSYAGGRALWLTYVGGNIREWSLWTATWTRPQPRLVRFVARDVDAPPPVVLGPANLTLLAYAVDRTVIGLDMTGKRIFSWTAPAKVTAVAVGTGTWVAVAGGGLYELNERGRPIEFPSLDGDASALVHDGIGIFAQIGRLLEARIGGTTASYRLPQGARLVDAAAAKAVYVVDGRVHVHDFSSGRDVSYPGTAAAVEDRALLVANGRQITIRPLA